MRNFFFSTALLLKNMERGWVYKIFNFWELFFLFSILLLCLVYFLWMRECKGYKFCPCANIPWYTYFVENFENIIARANKLEKEPKIRSWWDLIYPKHANENHNSSKKPFSWPLETPLKKLLLNWTLTVILGT